MPGMLINYPRNEVGKAFLDHAGRTNGSAPARRDGSTPRKETDGRRSGEKPHCARRAPVAAS